MKHVLWHLIFLLYINNVTDCVSYEVYLFDDVFIIYRKLEWL